MHGDRVGGVGVVFREKGGLIHSDQTGVSQPVMATLSNIPLGQVLGTTCWPLSKSCYR